MNKKSWISFVGILVVSSAWAATDISRQAYLPEIPGLAIQGEIPSEFTRRNEAARLGFSISSQDLAETLAKAGLPPLSEHTLLPKTVAQCAVSNATRHGTYEL